MVGIQVRAGLISAALFLCAAAFAAPASAGSVDKASCTFNGRKLQGKVQIVTAFPDVKVQVVDSFPDLNVQAVTAFPDRCGKWQFVDSFPDFKIQYVTAFPDIKIRMVESFPGVP